VRIVAQLIQELPWEDCLVEGHPAPALIKEYKKAYGNPIPGLDYFSSCDWLARSLLTINTNDGLLVHTDFDFFELLWLAVSQENSCRFCYAAHRAFLQIIGYSNSRIQRLEEEYFTTELAPKQKLALDFARRVSRSSPCVRPEDKQPLLEAGFEEAAVDELIFLTGLIIFANRFSTLLALPVRPVEEFFDGWLIRLGRPIFEKFLKSKRRYGKPQALAPGQRDGPYSALVRGLDGLPVAGPLRALIDQAWASTIVPARTRALIFAVVARAIDCQAAEQEARRLLADLDFGGEQVDEVLEHLSSPALDSAESVIVPFARETIRYQAQDIQRKARVLRDAIGEEQFIEVIGLASLANMVCRMAAVRKPD
jgi:AhpD family alkylhydroperoxidase